MDKLPQRSIVHLTDGTKEGTIIQTCKEPYKLKRIFTCRNSQHSTNCRGKTNEKEIIYTDHSYHQRIRHDAKEAEAAQQAAEETVKEAAEAAEPENLLEDFVGDMDLSGSWEDEVSKRASMDVVKNEDGSYDITVHWGGSATETAIWTIHGEYDPTSGMLSYEDGSYSIHTVDDKGNETISGEEKTNGAFMKEGDKLRWQDSKNAEQGLFSKTTE